MFLHHFSDGVSDGLILHTQSLIETHAQPLLQKLDDKLCPRHMSVVVLDPRHRPPSRQAAVEVSLHRDEKTERQVYAKMLHQICKNSTQIGVFDINAHELSNSYMSVHPFYTQIQSPPKVLVFLKNADYRVKANSFVFPLH